MTRVSGPRSCPRQVRPNAGPKSAASSSYRSFAREREPDRARNLHAASASTTAPARAATTTPHGDGSEVERTSRLGAVEGTVAVGDEGAAAGDDAAAISGSGISYATAC